MRFLMFVASDREPDAMPEGPGEAAAWVDAVGAKRIDGNRLRPPRQAKTVRVRGGKTIVTDGPFAESKETILGYDILECESIEEAIEIAARHRGRGGSRFGRSGRLTTRPGLTSQPAPLEPPASKSPRGFRRLRAACWATGVTARAVAASISKPPGPVTE
jgi:hypothetical protein